MPDALRDVAAERQRQITEEGWDDAHDDAHKPGELANAGCGYATSAVCQLMYGTPMNGPPVFWTWGAEWWKPKTPRRDLVRAAALLIAEIERLDRELPRTHGNWAEMSADEAAKMVTPSAEYKAFKAAGCETVGDKRRWDAAVAFERERKER